MKDAGKVIGYDVDTKEGQSGSPIFVLDKKIVRANHPCQQAGQLGPEQDLPKMAVGVHTGGGGRDYNVGTMITPAIDKWMREQMSQESSASICKMINRSHSVHVGGLLKTRACEKYGKFLDT